MTFAERIDREEAAGRLPSRYASMLREFNDTFFEAVEEKVENRNLLCRFLEFVVEQIEAPYVFSPYHQKITEPVDYYRFGLDFIRPLVVKERSTCKGGEHLQKMESLLNLGDNVILLANHQVEPDPQAISLLMEENHPKLAEEMIFVAGHRVTTDPLTVPFSKGRNLICIYSKKHIDHPPEKREEKLQHNHRALKRLQELLAEGGQCVYVAPSGGRDRPGPDGRIGVSPFDPQSVEMFLLLGKKSAMPTHFFPLALSTYALLPPPNSLMKDIGERRVAGRTPIHMAVGEELNLEAFQFDQFEKREARQKRADAVRHVVVELYEAIRA